MDSAKYEVNLNHITLLEQYLAPDTFSHYSRAVAVLLEQKGFYELESEIVEKLKDDKNVREAIENGKERMEAVRTAYAYRFVATGIKGKRKEEDEPENTWFDLRKDYIVTPQDSLYERFYAYKIRHTDIFELDNLLDYTFEKTPSGDKTRFIRFLKLILRQYGKLFISPEHVETINEWIAEKKESGFSGSEQIKTKIRVKRERDDKMTLLNQEQTALLIYCFRETKLILKDELLSNKEAGLAFSILTGYSADTIRQNLNKSEVLGIANEKNAVAIENALKQVLKFVDEQIKPE